MPKHMKVNLLTHMSLLANSHATQEAAIGKFEADIAEQKKEIAQQKAKINSQEAEIQQQRAELNVQQSQVVHLTTQNEELKRRCLTVEQNLSSLDKIIKQETSQLNNKLEASEKLAISTLPTPPILTMTDFQQHKRDNDWWFSPPVYTHHQGYRISLGVNAAGYETKKYVSVFVYFVCGKFDDFLLWPFRGVISFRLLSQVKDKEHKVHSCVYDDKVDIKACCQVTDQDRGAGRGPAKFIAHAELESDFLQNDSLQFQIFNVQCQM